MATTRRRSPPRVIDLVSSDDEDDEVQRVDPPPRPAPPPAINLDESDDELVASTPTSPDSRVPRTFGLDRHPDAFPTFPDDAERLQASPEAATQPDATEQDGTYEFFGDEIVWIPNDSQQTPLGQNSPRVKFPASEEGFHNDFPFEQIENLFTGDTCLQRVLDVFPDVSHDHVLKLYDELGQGDPPMPGADRYENIINRLVEADGYPKQGKGKSPELKRKAENDLKKDDFKRWEGADRPAGFAALKGVMAAALKADFSVMTGKAIKQEMAQHKHLFQTYVALAALRDATDTGWTGRPALLPDTADTILLNTGIPELYDELQAARRRVCIIRSDRTIALAKRQAEDENMKRATEAGETAECQACFDDLPMNRQIHCNGDIAHYTCFDCMVTYIKSEIGQSRCAVMCTAGCGADYAYAQLHLIDDYQLLEKLAQLQQEKDIRDAELENLEECPFCDFKAILPPIEEDFEFRCANPDCERVSCRRCKASSHIPKSCEEHAQDHKLDSKHKIEEAMTAALVRKCGRCSKPFIKEFGCNKMHCPSCGNLQCYVCSTSVKDYTHFNQSDLRAPNSSSAGSSDQRCPLYDNVEERHAREIKEAEERARAEAMEAHPGMSEEDLAINESDAVRQASQQRARQAGPYGGNYGLFGFDRGRLRNGANDNEGIDDGLLRYFAAQDHMAPLPQGRNELNLIRYRVAAERARLQARRAQIIRDEAVRVRLELDALQVEQDPIRRGTPIGGALGHGLGGHIAGHGVQAHVARRAAMYQGRDALRAPQGGVQYEMAGYMPMYGMQMPGAGRFPHHEAPAGTQANAVTPDGTAPHPTAHGLGNMLGVVGAGTPAPPAAAAAADDDDDDSVAAGPDHALGAQNNGFGGGQQGLIRRIFAELFEGDNADDAFGVGRMIAGEHDPHPFPELLGAHHARGRDAPARGRALRHALAREIAREYTAAAEAPGHGVPHMGNRAGGREEVYQPNPADPRRYHQFGAAFPGAPHAG